MDLPHVLLSLKFIPWMEDVARRRLLQRAAIRSSKVSQDSSTHCLAMASVPRC